MYNNDFIYFESQWETMFFKHFSLFSLDSDVKLLTKFPICEYGKIDTNTFLAQNMANFE